MLGLNWPPKSIPDFKAALRDVKSRDPQWRRRAAVALGRAKEEERESAAEALGVLLDDKDAAVRMEAVLSAGKLKASSLADRIAGFLDSDSAGQRMAALDFLSVNGSKRHFDKVREALSDDRDPDVRSMALETLSYLDPDRCYELVVEALDRPDDHGPEQLRTLIVLLSELGSSRDMGVLERFLKHVTMGVKVEAARILVLRGKVDDEELMTSILLDATRTVKDKRMRELAIEGLCRLRNDRVLEEARSNFRRLLVARLEKIYWAAICSRAGDKNAVKYLERMYRGRNVWAAAKVLWAAGLCGLESWIPIMEENIRRGAGSEENAFIHSAILALGVMGGKESVAALTLLCEELKDENPYFAGLIAGEMEVWGKSD